MLREWRTQTWLRLKAIVRRRQLDRDLDDEIAFHLSMREKKLAAGEINSGDAHYSARRQFGNTTSLKEVTREMWTFASLETLWQDIRYGFRMLRKNPGFTAAAILTLALGIGANTAIFSVVNAVLLRPLPFRDPGRLVSVLETKPTQGLDWLYVTPVNFVEWQRQTGIFENIAAFNGCGFRLSDQGAPTFVRGACASSDFIPMLGVQPIMGRLWTAKEDLPGNDREVLLSYSFWKTQFGGDPNVIGKSLWRGNDKVPFAIIGVLPDGFQFESEDISVWAPLGIDMNTTSAHFHSLLVFARLKQGGSREEAQSTMDGIAKQLEKQFPKTNTGWGVTVQPLQKFYSNLGNTRTSLLVMLAAVGTLLLIACANVANLLLARAAVRQKEVAVRVAIGATRLRLVRQLLTESILLGVLGGGAGFLLAWAAFGSLMSIAPQIPSFQPHAIRIDGSVLFFSLTASLLASIFFGLTPALKVSKQDLNQSLREASRGLHGSVRDRAARHLLVISEVGLAVILLIGTGLLIESFRNLQRDHLGFNADHVLTMNICCLDQTHYPTQTEVSAFYRSLFNRLEAVPGVESASATISLPMRQFDGAGSLFLIQGRPIPEPGHEIVTDWRVVGPDYFHMMQIPMARGRAFSMQDDETHAPAAIINEAMARRFFPDPDPIGQQVQIVNMQPMGRWFNVIGVASNSRDRGLGKDTRSTIYVNNLQASMRGAVVLVRTKAEPHTLITPVRETLRSLNGDLSITNAQTFDEAMDKSLSPERFSVLLLTLFAGLALCLACIGVYGVTTFTVSQRTHELGVRIAMGAQGRDVFLLIVGQGLRMALAGIAVGLIGAFVLTRFMTSLFFGVSARDPLTLIVVCAILTAVTVLACYVPARRAMRVDPMIALRHD